MGQIGCKQTAVTPKIGGYGYGGKTTPKFHEKVYLFPNELKIHTNTKLMILNPNFKRNFGEINILG